MKHGRQFRGPEMNVKRHQNQHFIRTNKQQRTTFLSGERKRPIQARPTLAAEQCLKVKPNLNIDPAMQPTYAKYADTAHCFLRIDGKVIINRTCHIGVSGDTREWAMNGVAEVYMNHENHDLSDRPFYARFQRHGRWLNYGRVETVDAREEHICWGNKRFHMCFSQPYLICDPDGNLPKRLETY